MADRAKSATTKISSDALISALEGTFKKYAALDDGLALVLSLWTLATHIFACFDAFPYLAITSPTKRCGKTRLAEIIDIFACDVLRTAGASPAAIFRTIQARKLEDRTVTLIMDEAEVLGTKSERAEQLREVLNAGYRAGQKMLRCQKWADDTFEPQEFEVYCPKVSILIGMLQDTLADRCIPISMRRRKPNEPVERFFYSLAKRQARGVLKGVDAWAKSSRQKVKRWLRRDLKFLQDREAELWLPIFSVCQVAAPQRAEELRLIALRISHSKESDEPEKGVLLLQDIRTIFDRNGESRISTTGLIYALHQCEESPWSSWSKGRGLDARSLARLLRPFKISPQNVRIDDHVMKGYERDHFHEAWDTYLPANSSAIALQANTGAGSSDFSSRYTGGNVADEKCEIANENGACSGVAVPDGEEAQNQGGFTGELIPPRPPGTVLLSWELKPAPVTIGAGETVTDPAKFARGCLEQLGIALVNPRCRVGWSVTQLLDRLAQVGVVVALQSKNEEIVGLGGYGSVAEPRRQEKG